MQQQFENQCSRATKEKIEFPSKRTIHCLKTFFTFFLRLIVPTILSTSSAILNLPCIPDPCHPYLPIMSCSHCNWPSSKGGPQHYTRAPEESKQHPGQWVCCLLCPRHIDSSLLRAHSVSSTWHTIAFCLLLFFFIEVKITYFQVLSERIEFLHVYTSRGPPLRSRYTTFQHALQTWSCACSVLCL